MKKTLLLLMLVLSISNTIHSQSLAEKKEANRRKPKNNTLSKVLGVAAGAGATKIAMDKSKEKKVYRPYTKKELKKIKAYFTRIGTFQANYRTGSNNKSGLNKMDQQGLEISYRLPHYFTLNYRNKEYSFADDSIQSINQYFLDYSLMPILIGASVSQVGAFVGIKATRVVPSSLETNHDPIFGLHYSWHNLNSFYSLHARYFSSITNFSDFTMDSLTEVFARGYWEFIQADLGAELDLTDTENIDASIFARIGVKF